MAAKRLTKEDIRKTTGILNPVGHVVLAFKDDATMTEAVAALRDAGFTEADILVYPAEEGGPRACASGFARRAKRPGSDSRSR